MCICGVASSNDAVSFVQNRAGHLRGLKPKEIALHKMSRGSTCPGGGVRTVFCRSRPHNVTWYGDLISRASLRADSQRDSKQFPIAALVIEAGALKLLILKGGGAVRTVFRRSRPHNVTWYGDLISRAQLGGDS
jgi:hypothetical protein